MKKFFGMVLLLILIGVGWLTFKSYTPPIFKPEAVAELRAIDVNGDKQYLLIRGHDREAPILLFLHGGPGMPAMYLAHKFQRGLEKESVVVHWDQRHSGKSLKKNPDPASVTTSQLIDDAEEVVAYLKDHFSGQDIILAGHSHGSYLGMLLLEKRPDAFAAYVGIGQVADEERAIDEQDIFLKSQLNALGLSENTQITNANRENLLFQTGSEIFGETSFIPLVVAGMLAPEYSMFDVARVKNGSAFSSRHMKRDVIDGPLMQKVTKVERPVYFIMGEHDMVTPVSLAREYFNVLEAPSKEFILMDDTAHFPFFEDPAKFTEILTRIKNETVVVAH